MKPEEKIERAYEELRAIIDGGSESFTHEDAVQYLKDRFAQTEQEPVAFVVKQYVGTGRPSIKGNGFDGLEIGYTREEADEFIAWVNFYTTPPQRTWVKLMRGVRVEGDTVVISVKGGNDAARELCGELINEMNK